MYTGRRLSPAQGNRSVLPAYSVVGRWPGRRSSPTPRAAAPSSRVSRWSPVPRSRRDLMPHTVRLPNIVFSVAKVEAVTVASRVVGFVTMGPTVNLCVAARI